MTTVLFVCVHNAGRSQMAATFFNAFADAGKATAISAGTEPASKVHPAVVDVMRELGFDLADVKPRKLTDELTLQVQMFITMGCGESCPVVPRVIREDWQIPDPKGKSPERVREIRDDLARKVRDLIQAKGWGKPSTS